MDSRVTNALWARRSAASGQSNPLMRKRNSKPGGATFQPGAAGSAFGFDFFLPDLDFAGALVLVGATNVGRISLAFSPLRSNSGQPGGETLPPEPIPVARGDELGRFNLGSTVVLLAADPALAPAEAPTGSFVRMGQALWRREPRRS